jgi:hypothetical protein
MYIEAVVVVRLTIMAILAGGIGFMVGMNKGAKDCHGTGTRTPERESTSSQEHPAP